MARPKSKELTERELDVMHVFWNQEEATADQVRQKLGSNGNALAYVTVANVVRGLAEKGFLKQLNSERPFRYQAARTFDEVAGSLVGHLMQRVFAGSREQLLLQVLGKRRLTKKERLLLQEILDQQDK